MVQDNSFEGYQQIPAWILEGYSTLLTEVNQQLSEKGLDTATLMVSPVGVGSLAHAVVAHCKGKGRQCSVMSVEPDTAPCLHHSLKAGRSVPIDTSNTASIMDGLNCGTVSMAAFKDLQAGVDISVVASDMESHQAVQFLKEAGVGIGALWRGHPCCALEAPRCRGYSTPVFPLRRGSRRSSRHRRPEGVSSSHTDLECWGCHCRGLRIPSCRRLVVGWIQAPE